MIRYLTLLLLSVIGAAIALLPGDFSPPRPEVTQDPGELRWANVQRAEVELRGIQSRMDLIRLHDAMADRVVEAHQSGAGPLIEPTPAAHLAPIADLERAIAENDLGTGVAIGAIVTVMPDGAPPFRAPDRTPEFFAGRRNGVTYCFRHVAIQEMAAQRPSNQWPTHVLQGRRGALRELGPCALIQRYGLPGEHVSRWINQQGRAFMAETRPVAEWEGRGFGLTPHPSRYGALPIQGRACLNGWDEMCLRDFDPLPPNRDFEIRRGIAHIAVSDNSYRSSRQNVLGRYLRPIMIVAIENDFGSEAFEEFWTSDQEIPTAFEAAFGMTLAEWMQRWGSQYYEGLRAGPAPDLVEVLTALSIVLLLMYVAVRRQSIRSTA